MAKKQVKKNQDIEIWLRTYLFDKVKILNPNVTSQNFKGYSLIVARNSFVAIMNENGVVIKRFPKYLLLAYNEYRVPTDEEIHICYEYWRKKEGKNNKKYSDDNSFSRWDITSPNVEIPIEVPIINSSGGLSWESYFIDDSRRTITQDEIDTINVCLREMADRHGNIEPTELSTSSD